MVSNVCYLPVISTYISIFVPVKNTTELRECSDVLFFKNSSKNLLGG